MYINAINGDKIARNKFQQLIEQHKIKTVIETGTYHGVTTEWLASIVDTVHTIELDPRYYETAKLKLEDLANVSMHFGSSPDILRKIMPVIEKPIFFFLDAHWGPYCPMLDELRVIPRESNPVIAIHDFLVPGTTLGYDIYQGKPFSLDYIEGLLPRLYSNGYVTQYNDETAEGARRGIVYISPW